MPRSTTIWAAALLLASLSGSGSILTTAEAMPAPGPQQTAGKPRYYFPRHVKRQIVTNSTAPASSTSSTSSSSTSTADLESRQPDISSFFESLFNPPALSSSDTVSSSSSDAVSSTVDAARTTTVVTDITVTPVPVAPSSGTLIGTGNQPLEPLPSSTLIIPQPPIPIVISSDAPLPSSSVVGSTAGLPEPIVLPTSRALPIPTPSDIIPSAPTDVGSTGGLPQSVVQPTSVLASSVVEPIVPSSIVVSTGGLPLSIVLPSSVPIVAPTGILPSSIVQPTDLPIPSATGILPSSIVLPTGVLPSSIVLPSEPATSAADAPVVATSDVASTGGIPESIVSPSPSAPSREEPSSTVGTTILGPFIIPSSTDGLPATIIQPSLPLGTSEILPSLSLDLPFGSTGVLPTPTGLLPTDSILLPTSDPVLPSENTPVSLPTSGIVVGITTAFGTTGSDLPTPTGSLPIPTSESASQSDVLPIVPSLLSSLLSELQPTETLLPTGILPSITVGPTAPGITADPLPSLISDLSSALSAITSDVNSIVSSVVSQLPTGIPDIPSIVSSIASSVGSQLASDLSSGILPTGTLPLPSLPVSSIVSSLESSLATAIPTLLPGTSSGIVPPSLSSGVPSGTGVTTAPTDVSTAPTGIPTSEVPPSSSGTDIPTTNVPLPTGTGITSSGLITTGTGISTSETALPTDTAIPTSEGPSGSDTTVLPSSTNATGEVSAPATPTSTPFVLPTSTPTLIFNPPTITAKPTVPSQPPVSILPTATDSETTYIVGTSIIQEPSTAASPSPTATGISSDLPVMIAPPGGPKQRPDNAFLGQIGFKWPLNYPFVCANDGGNQIFTYLPIAIADALNISVSEVVMNGLKPIDTTQYAGYITTLALFFIPADLNSTLAAQLHSPPDPFWHNKNETVNQLTNLINTAFPLGAGRLPGDGETSPSGDLLSTPTGDTQGGGAMGGDMGASRKVNPTSAGIATGAVMGAIAYGAAMFFVARRYRNRKISHKRSPSVPSTSRFTYGSMTNGGAFMSGARGLGQSPPGGRDSRGSSSSNGRSVRTQQISAPVMAENSLGWN